MTNTNVNNELKTVVDGGFCSGCGACAVTLNTKIKLNTYGEYNPDTYGELTNQKNLNSNSDALSACPFLVPELNEDVLARPLFEHDCQYDSSIGYYYSIYAGFVKEGSYRDDGTSGGMGTWIGAELMRLGKIDAVIHVKPVASREVGEPYFSYGVSSSIEEVKAGAKTRYHVVEISGVMQLVRERPGRYLFIGVPCFCKAVRRLQRVDTVIAERIQFVVSLICGHLKSVHWTLSLAWGGGIHPTDLSAFQYRSKGPDIPARAYVFKAISTKNPPIQQNSASVIGGKFNAGALMLKACDYCDDVVGETADLTIGDAWIPKFEVDSRGTNLIIIRNSQLNNVMLDAEIQNRLHLDKVLVEEAVKSQSGGFRHRREGLSYRLDKAIKEGRWVPGKRVKAGDFNLSKARKKIYEARINVAYVSREAFREALIADNFSIYRNRMIPIVKKLRFLELKSSFFRAVGSRLMRYLLKIKLSFSN